ncbi:MAG TPA: NAD(P)/FAD-dependent oxidoreductase [Nocardioides sp.]|nr:NAD(P)/FAD-dependent oxidoreductase [Nocardioides sp.]
MDYDVIIVGAGIAGCTAATAYGRAGVRVALLERHRSPQAHKTLCGHFVLGGTHGVLQDLGLWQPMLAEGAAVSDRLGVWTEGRWILPPPGRVPPAISLRRSKLDPLLRRLAGETPGVDLLPGRRVVDLVRDKAGTVTGVVTTGGGDGERSTLSARLVVGADGHRSTVARLAEVAEDRAVNNRFLFWAYYEGVEMNGPGAGQVWMRDRDVAVCIRVDDGLTQLGVFATKDEAPRFVRDRHDALESYVADLPAAPSLTRARRASTLVGTTDYPCIRRNPVPRPGIALIGDAATTSDPVPAVGCGWAFRSAAWLVENTAADLAAGRDPRRGLRGYRRAHRFIEKYDDLGRQDALAQPPTTLQRRVRAAAAADPEIARRMAMFAMRAEAPSVLLNPRVLVRAALHAAR